jgi:hypothetical protein
MKADTRRLRGAVDKGIFMGSKLLQRDGGEARIY